MKKSIIFPANNKGGVGKTSLLIDLARMLSADYRVALIDTDGQGTFYETLTRKSTGGFYSGLETSVANIHHGANFRFSQGARKLKVKIKPAHAPAAIIPVGMLYESPERKAELEEIIRGTMADSGIILMDLPPIPHAALILDYSLKPLLETLDFQAVLFPVIVTTPEKNTLDIGLRGYEMIRNYLSSIGIRDCQVHPIVVANKVMGSVHQNKMSFSTLDSDDAEKLAKIGIIYYAKNGFFEFKRSFEYDSQRYRAIWLPFIEGLRHGQFGLINSDTIELFHFPQVSRQVADKMFGFAVYKKGGVMEIIYAEQMGRICNYISAHSRQPFNRSFSVEKYERDTPAAKTEIVRDIRRSLLDVYESVHDFGMITGGAYRSKYVVIMNTTKGNISIGLLQDIPKETLALAIAETERELGIKSEMDESSGNYDSIHSCLDWYTNKLMEVRIAYGETDIEIRFENCHSREGWTNQKGLFDGFLERLDKQLSKSPSKTI